MREKYVDTLAKLYDYSTSIFTKERFTAWHDNATGAMCFETQNTACALRSDGTGALKVKHLGSSQWMTSPFSSVRDFFSILLIFQ